MTLKIHSFARQRNASVCEVKHPLTYEGPVPKQDGLLDLRMGTIQREFLCATCGNENDHFYYYYYYYFFLDVD